MQRAPHGVIHTAPRRRTHLYSGEFDKTLTFKKRIPATPTELAVTTTFHGRRRPWEGRTNPEGGSSLENGRASLRTEQAKRIRERRARFALLDIKHLNTAGPDGIHSIISRLRHDQHLRIPPVYSSRQSPRVATSQILGQNTLPSIHPSIDRRVRPSHHPPLDM